MESAIEFEARPETVGEKRLAAEDLEVSQSKKIRGGSQQRLVRDAGKVAEMVLVLAAMGKMRGGRGPSDVEKELMAEARNTLAKVCDDFAPKDVFPSDAFGVVIEDMGLNKLKEQRLGFLPPKMSIAEKLLISKRKMEKAEDFSLLSTPHSSPLHPNSSAAVESRNTLHTVRMTQPDKSSHMSISSGGFQSASPFAHSTTINSATLPYQLPNSEVRPVVPSSLPSIHLNNLAALPRVDRPHLRSDGRPSGYSHPSQVQANYSANSSMKTPTWSLQPQSVLSSKTGSDNKVPMNTCLKVEGAAGIKSGLAPQTSRTVVSETIGLPSQGINRVQPPLGNAHSEIGKIVQNLLQPRVSERPTWVPPSRDYMNKPLTCQMCMSTVMEIDSVLICDACEKGYHLKCLQTTNQKVVPRGEWHCVKCLSLSNGKPLPPKYGRVMRNINTPKVSSNSEAVTSNSSKEIDAADEVSQPKAMVNGNSIMENNSSGVVGNNYGHQTSGSERKESKVMLENDNASSSSKMEDKLSSGSRPYNLMKTSNCASVSSVSSLVEKANVGKAAKLKPNFTETGMSLGSSDESQAVGNAAEASSSKQSLENHLVERDSKESQGDESSNNLNQLKEGEVVRDNPSGTAASAGTMNDGSSSSDGLPAANWVGDPIQTLHEKVYYPSCCINGRLYKLMDHVLIRFGNGKLVPSKLKAMWEDKTTTLKWVMVNQCYFPGDLPEAVGRPCGLESSEVYESTCGRAFMAGLIESPCEVLPPRRFAEENERRIRSGKQTNDHLPPLYLCKWIYDEAKGLFRDISC